jgi:hypothetical protein
MTLSIQCPSCKGKLRTPDDLAGRMIKCPKCGKPVAIPTRPPAGPATTFVQAESIPKPVRHSPSIGSSKSFDASLSNLQKEDGQDQRRLQSDASTGRGVAIGLGIASMVLGVVALLFSFIPSIGLFSMPVSGLGLLLGLIGGTVALCRSGRGIGFPIAGSAINSMALVVAFFWLGLASITHSALEKSSKAIDQSIKEENATNQRIDEGEKKPEVKSGSDAPVAPKVEEVEWADARKIVRQGDVLVAISSVTIDQVQLDSILGERSLSRDKLLVIRLRIGNAGQTRKIEYESWGDTSQLFDRHVPILKDNFNNNYRRMSFDLGTRVQEQLSSESIHPGMSVDDVLVFEQPLDRISYLRLELPASAFGGKGQLRFQIPNDVIDLERKRQSEVARRQQAEARRQEELAKWKAELDAKAEAERQSELKAEAQKNAKVEAEQEVARKADLEAKGLSYYPRPRTVENGHNAEEWYKLLRENPLNARIYEQATTALSALKEEGTPFLLDHLSRETTQKGRHTLLKLIPVQSIHRNDLHKLLPCLDASKNYQGTRLLALQYLEKRAKDLRKELAPKIESLVQDMLENPRYSEETKEEIRKRLKTIRLESNAKPANQ